jgi:apolipoprotein N-acyltransferase
MRDRDSLVLGQKYAYATAALVMGLISYINLLSMEKAIVALVFGWLALRSTPAPALIGRRWAAITGVVLAGFLLVAVPVTLALHRDQLASVIRTLQHAFSK